MASTCGNKHLFTSESVTKGHPDKMADQISDAVLDSLIRRDPVARVACETLVTTGLVVIAGEVTVHNHKAEKALLEVDDTAREVIRSIGYDDPATGFDRVDAAAERILTTNPQRVSFQLTNLSANVIYIGITNQVTPTHGIRLAPNGGFVSLIWDRDFELVSHEWWAVATVNNSDIYMLRNLID